NRARASARSRGRDRPRHDRIDACTPCEVVEGAPQPVDGEVLLDLRRLEAAPPRLAKRTRLTQRSVVRPEYPPRSKAPISLGVFRALLGHELCAFSCGFSDARRLDEPVQLPRFPGARIAQLDPHSARCVVDSLHAPIPRLCSLLRIANTMPAPITAGGENRPHDQTLTSAYGRSRPLARELHFRLAAQGSALRAYHEKEEQAGAVGFDRRIGARGRSWEAEV